MVAVHDRRVYGRGGPVVRAVVLRGDVAVQKADARRACVIRLRLLSRLWSPLLRATLRLRLILRRVWLLWLLILRRNFHGLLRIGLSLLRGRGHDAHPQKQRGGQKYLFDFPRKISHRRSPAEDLRTQSLHPRCCRTVAKLDKVIGFV